MADVVMAGQAVSLLALGIVKHAAGHSLMAVNAVVDGDLAIKRSYAQWIGELAGSKRETVIPAVNSFYKIFAEQAFGSVAAVEVGDLFMGRVVPCIELIAHNVAIEAGLGIIKKVRATSSIDKGEQS